MININAKIVQELRQKTGVGMMDCKKALQETNGDIEAAIVWIRKRTRCIAYRPIDEIIAAEGVVSSYVHTGGKVAVVRDVN